MTSKPIAYKPATNNKRVEASLTREIKSTPSKIFPLACPVEELRWIPDWDYRMIYSQSGVNESHCIFSEEMSGPHFFGKELTTTWITVNYNPDTHFIQFQIMLGQKASLGFYLSIRQVGENRSACTWRTIYTALDQEANNMEEEDIRVKLELLMTFLAEALKHYCENGKMLS